MPYRLYIDEVGNDDLGHLDDDRHRFLSLTGVAMRLDYTRDQATPAMNRIKGEIFHPDPDGKPILFHRKDILQRKGIFGVLSNEALRTRFDEMLLGYLDSTDYVVITGVIDKKAMTEQDHWQEKHPYHYLLDIIVEKYVQFLERKNDVGDVMPEMRKGVKDRELQKAFENIRRHGTYYLSFPRIQAKLHSSHLKFRCKEENITGLQICDLIAHPSYTYVRTQQGHELTPGVYGSHIATILHKKKYDRSMWGKIKGYGYKYLP